MALAQVVVNLGHGLREKANQRVRHPLDELRLASSPHQRSAIMNLADVIRDELNIKEITACEDLDDLVTYVYRPNQKMLGPKYGKLLGAISKALSLVPPSLLDPLRKGVPVALPVDGAEVVLAPDDVFISTVQAADWACADEEGVQIAISTKLTPELLHEGIARDFVRQVQQLRKEADLEIEQRIQILHATTDADVLAALEAWGRYVREETLADSLQSAVAAASAKSVLVGTVEIPLWIQRS